VIGTPDDAVDVLKKLQAKQGEFGAFLQQAHDWANWENTKRSYELYIRYVVPHFNGMNANREKSYGNWKENSVAYSGKMGAAAKATLARVDRVLSDETIADVARSAHDLRLTADTLAAHRAMFGTIDHAAGDIASSAAGVRQIVHGDGHQAFADLAVAAHDLKDTVHAAHGVVSRFDGQSGVITATTIPRLNTTLDSVARAADSVHGLIRDIRNDPRAVVMKPKGRQQEIRP